MLNQGRFREIQDGIRAGSDRPFSSLSSGDWTGGVWFSQRYQRSRWERASEGRSQVRVSPVATRFSRYEAIAPRQASAVPPSSPSRSIPPVKSMRVGQVQTGHLSSSDRHNPTRRGRFADDYGLSGYPAGQSISISLTSSAFDGYLQIIDQSTGDVIAQSDDAFGNSTDARVPLTLKAGVTYRIRVTSYNPDEMGTYRLSITDNPFDLDYGYGLVNAAAAVAEAMGRSRFSPVAPWGEAKKHWNLNMIQAPEVWANGITGEGVVVAVLDTGVNYTHPDLARNLWINPDEIPHNGRDDDHNGFVDDVRGWNFVDGGNNNVMDAHGHGTHVAGTIAAVRNSIGATGVAYGATIMPVRVIGGHDDTSLTRFDRNVAAGIRYAVDNGADVLNLSLGNDPQEPPMPQTRSALVYARQQGVVVVMAAGNEKQQGANQPIEPASYAIQGLGISVGAIGQRRVMADFSNPAGDRPMPFVVAPGTHIWSTIPDDRYAQQGWSGTSMATPHVTGVVALMLSANPTLTPSQVATILTTTANSNGISIG